MMRRTISISPAVDKIVWRVWVGLLQRGCSMSYSRTLQLIVLTAAGDGSDDAVEGLINSIEQRLKSQAHGG